MLSEGRTNYGYHGMRICGCGQYVVIGELIKCYDGAVVVVCSCKGDCGQVLVQCCSLLYYGQLNGKIRVYPGHLLV